MQRNFCGYLEYADLSGNVVQILRIKDGNVVRVYTPKGGGAMAKGRSAVMGTRCWDECFPKYDWICEGDYNDTEAIVTCREEYVGLDCTTYCEWVPDPSDPNPSDPDPDPHPVYYDCNGDHNGQAYMAPCGCIGGNTGLTSCPSNNDPCDGVRKGNELKNNAAVNNAINNIKNNTSETGHKFFLSSNSASGAFQLGPAVSSGSNSSVDLSPFTWDPSRGYVIGHMHNHPQGNAPNPSDVMNGVNLAQMSNMPGISYEEVNLYTKNFAAVVVTSSYVYTVTIKDADAYKAAQSNFDQVADNQTWLNLAINYKNTNPSATDQEAGEYALLSMYGNAINLTKQNVNSTNSNEALNLNVSNKVTTNDPC